MRCRVHENHISRRYFISRTTEYQRTVFVSPVNGISAPHNRLHSQICRHFERYIVKTSRRRSKQSHFIARKSVNKHVIRLDFAFVLRVIQFSVIFVKITVITNLCPFSIIFSKYSLFYSPNCRRQKTCISHCDSPTLGTYRPDIPYPSIRLS